MRTASYQNNYEKVFKRAKAVIRRKRFLLVDEDLEKGILTAVRHGNLIKPTFKMQVNINKIDSTSTNVNVIIEVKKHWFRVPEVKLKTMEGRFISMLS